MLVAVLVIAALAGSALLCRFDTRLWPAVLIGLCLVWPLVNKPLEGPVLLVLARGHGITVSDLISPAGAVFGAVLLYRRRPESRRTQRAGRQPTENSRSDSIARSSVEDLPMER